MIMIIIGAPLHADLARRRLYRHRGPATTTTTTTTNNHDNTTNSKNIAFRYY